VIFAVIQQAVVLVDFFAVFTVKLGGHGTPVYDTAVSPGIILYDEESAGKDDPEKQGLLLFH
jgi:hypothetical protein